jgi:hypothetical protein
MFSHTVSHEWGVNDPSINCKIDRKAFPIIFLENGEINIKAVFPELNIPKEQELSDILTSSFKPNGQGLWCNHRFLEVLEYFGSEYFPKYYFFPCRIKTHSGTRNDYGWLQFTSSLIDYIDFQASQFYETDILLIPQANVEINSMKEFYDIGSQIFKSDGHLYVKRHEIVLNKSSPELIFLCLPPLNQRYICTLKFRDILEKYQISGFEFHPI